MLICRGVWLRELVDSSDIKTDRVIAGLPSINIAQA